MYNKLYPLSDGEPVQEADAKKITTMLYEVKLDSQQPLQKPEIKHPKKEKEVGGKTMD